jgi:hypothetical protein
MVLKNNTSDNKNIYYIKIDEKKSDFVFIVVSIIILSILSYLLYHDIYKSSEGAGKPIGTIVFKKRVALRKLKNQSIWEYLQNEYPVFNGDAIKTEEFSEAVLKLNDGTEIALNENTFIVLNFTDQETKIEFNYGSIEANSESKNQIKVKTQDSEIELTSANAKLVQTNDNIQIQLNKGNANITKNNKTETIKENEVALLDRKSEEIQKQQNRIVYLSPNDNERFFTTEQNFKVNFSFDAQPNKNYELQISMNPNFRPVLLKIPLKNNQATIDLNHGTYYWKIIDKDSDPNLSNFRKFVILKQEKPSLYLPKNNQKFTTKDQINIDFSWSKLDLASSYEIWIDNDPNFSDPQKINVLTNGLSIPIKINNNKNTFYWKVIPKSTIENAVKESETFSFYVEKIASLKPSILQFPNNDIYHIKSFEKGINFSWQNDIPNKQTLQIALDKEFNQVILNIPDITSNFYLLKKELPVGTYYWRVINQDNLSSNVHKFTITSAIGIEMLTPQENKIFFYEKNDNIQFRWKIELDNIKYKFVLSNSKNFNTPILEETLSEPIKIISTNILKKEGEYFWKIEIINKNDDRKLNEKISNFFVYHYPEKTKMIQPTNNQAINLIKRNNLVLQWQKTNYTDFYYIEIYKNGERVYNDKSNQNTFNFKQLNLLGIGVVDLKIYSVRVIDKIEYKSEPEVCRIILEYKLDKKPEFLTPDKIIIE